jgi:hypothetical protein
MTDERYQKIMSDLGMPNSRSLLQALQQVANEVAQQARAAERDKITRLTEWMTQQGLLHYHAFCKRPDGSSGPAWIVRRPSIINGDSCEAWSETAAGAVDAWLSGPTVIQGAVRP